jgi:hypothetical protein
VLADNSTVNVIGSILLPITFIHNSKFFTSNIDFLIIETLSRNALIGFSDIISSFYELFQSMLAATVSTSSDMLLSRADIRLLPLSERTYDVPDTVSPWVNPPSQIPDEEYDTPLPAAFGKALEAFGKTAEEAFNSYDGLFDTHVSPELVKASPEFLDYLRSDAVRKQFNPTDWTGLRGFPPYKIRLKEGAPTHLRAYTRPINPVIKDAYNAEFERLKTYFFRPSTSTVASPIVIATKKSPPYVRFCGDYRKVNKWIEIPNEFIPFVLREVTKAAKFSVFFDIDATNAFHQVVLHPDTSRFLAVQTVDGLYEPRFMPEGIGPASGMLQYVVRTIFQGYEEWLLCIFDNFLICAHDYLDGVAKFKLVMERAIQYNLIFKFSKSFLGYTRVSFFGYEIKDHTYGLSVDRAQSIEAIPMPDSVVKTQRFLGMTGYYKPFIPNYSALTARLHDMTAKTFVWDKRAWKHDYEADFINVKEAIKTSTVLHYPQYDLPWVVQADASDMAVGAVLVQEVAATSDDGKPVTHRCPIALCSKKFTAQAFRWDTFKKEAYALYYAILQFSYFLIGKQFTLETDHRNLVWIEASEVAIVIRWRVYMQDFNFVLKHIPGKENVFADALSRMYYLDQFLSHLTGSQDWTPDEWVTHVRDGSATSMDLLRSFHGGLQMHQGALRTWNWLNRTYVGHGIPFSTVEDFCATCPTCQKVRHGDVNKIKSTIRTIKPPHFRVTIGIDHLTITPKASNGDCNLLVLVDQYTHFVYLYPMATYDAPSVAEVLYYHYGANGYYDELCSDPGSAFMSHVVTQLNAWFGVRHKVSLVDRHESNGVERVNKEILRHLRSIIHDERIAPRWNTRRVLGAILLILNREIHGESDISPFEAMFGRAAHTYGAIPATDSPAVKQSTYLQLLAEDMLLIQDIIRKSHEARIFKRSGMNPIHPNYYAAGDFVLWQRDPSPKLLAPWSGPYLVLSSRNNDVTCKDLISGAIKEFHVDRLKLFAGSSDDAFAAAQRDNDQNVVSSIKGWKGDPKRRSNMDFLVLFADGDLKWLRYSKDIADTVAFASFCERYPPCRLLLYTEKEASKQRSALLKLPLDQFPIYTPESRDPLYLIKPHTICYVDLRSWSEGSDYLWYYSLDLPDQHDFQFVVKCMYGAYVNNKRKRIDVSAPIFNSDFDVSIEWVSSWGSILTFDSTSMRLVDFDFVRLHPQVLPASAQVSVIHFTYFESSYS